MAKRVCIILSLLAFLSLLCCCTKKGETLSLSRASASLSVGESTTLVPTTSLEGAGILFSSSDERVATVSSNGLVTGIAAGTATITATLSGHDGVSASCVVTVSGSLPALPLLTKALSLSVGEESSILYEDGFTASGVRYVSSDPELVSVDALGTVHALASGSATITLTSDSHASATIEVTVTLASLVISGPKTVNVGARITLAALYGGEEDTDVLWSTSEATIATVSASGVVKGKKDGTVTITATDEARGLDASWEVTVSVPKATAITLTNTPDGVVPTTAEIYLIATVEPLGASQEVLWDSSDERIVSVDEGSLAIHLDGHVTITVTSATDPEVMTSCEIEVTYDPMQVIIDSYLSSPYHQFVTTYGNSEKKEEVKGAAFLFSLKDYATDWKTQNSTVEMLIPAGSANRPGTKQTKTYFILVHDTANNETGANALMHAKFEYNNGNNKSWHYNVGAEGIYHSIPDDEIAYNAEEDGRKTYHLLDTGVKAMTTVMPTFTISAKGYYVLDGTETTLLAPLKSDGTRAKAADLNDQGLSAEIGPNGNWYMGESWYSPDYGVIGTYGGAMNTIAMETCVDAGSDLYQTWQYAAKLVARLMVLHGIDLDHVVQHHFFSGKDCPMTMRHAGYWPTFKEMVWSEYLMETHLYSQGYTVSITSSTPSVLSNDGRVVSIPAVATAVTLTVTLHAPDGSTRTKTFTPIVHY